MIKAIKIISTTSLLILLAACGGGGGSGSGSTEKQVTNGGSTGNDSGTPTQSGGDSTAQNRADQSPSIEGMRWTIAPIFTGTLPQFDYNFNDNGQYLGNSHICPYGTTRPEGCNRPFITDASGQVNYFGEEWYKRAVGAINNAGQILGSGIVSDPVTGTEKNITFVYSNNQYTEVPASSWILNNKGDVAGYEWVPSGLADPANAYRSFIYSNGVKTTVNPLPGHYNIRVNAMNDMGEMVGESTHTTDYYEQRAFLYSNGALKNLGVLPGFNHSKAVDINRSGQVAGTSFEYDPSNISIIVKAQPFIYTNGSMKPIPSDGRTAQALSLNDIGQVVGYFHSPGETGNAAGFIYSGGKTTDLNTLPDVINNGWKISMAYNINNGGQILGEGTHNGAWKSFIMTPVTPK